MIKFNWGTGIVIFFALYISTLVLFVIESRKVDHSLVMKDYYAYDIAFDDIYQKIRNCNIYNQDVVFQQRDQGAILEFDFGPQTENIAGNIQMYRPSGSSMDIVIPFTLNKKGILHLKKQPFSDGHWVVKIDWQIGDKAFYKELPVNLNSAS